MKRIFITGSAGFIGFHLAREMLNHGFIVQGFDGYTDYYDVQLKYDRNDILLKNKNFNSTEGMLEDKENLLSEVKKFNPDIIVHLAAQAGVRYSLENPRAYIDSNIIGSFNVMEIASECDVSHLLMASTSSVYGANEDMLYDMSDRYRHMIHASVSASVPVYVSVFVSVSVSVDGRSGPPYAILYKRSRSVRLFHVMHDHLGISTKLTGLC